MKKLLLLLIIAAGCHQQTTVTRRLAPTNAKTAATPKIATAAVGYGKHKMVRLHCKPYQGVRAYVITKRDREWRLLFVGGVTEGWFDRNDFTTED